jgi:hypothetical protein
MDARVAKFIEDLGIEENFRNGLLKTVENLRNTPNFIAATPSPERISKLIAELTNNFITEYGRLMEEKIQPQHLDALLAYMKTSDGHHIVWGLYMTQVGMMDRITPMTNEFVGKLFEKSKK